MKDKIIAVIGPTASGKTSLAIKIAKKFNGELINTDSRQIYKYLDIGTAKGDVKRIKNEELRIKDEYFDEELGIKKLNVYKLEGARIHLINIVEPDKILTLSQYQKLAYNVIDDILSSKKIPVLVGGTGLYIDAIVKDYKIPKVKPNIEERKELEKYSVNKLQNALIDLDRRRYDSLNESDLNNHRRLIRAIEISRKNKEIIKTPDETNKYDVLFLMPYHSREDLYERINKRVDIILEEGLIEEVKELIEKGYEFDTPAFTGISYPIVKDYIEGKINMEELKERFAQGDRNYARRQMTWFKRYDYKKITRKKEAYKMIKDFI